MYRHFKNINELVIYASLSCAGSFTARQFPGLWVPIMLLRLGVCAYCIWLLVFAEKQKVVAGLIGTSLFLGAIGGYWDYLEIVLRFDGSKVTRSLTIVFCGLLAVSGLVIQYHVNRKVSKK